VRLPKILIMDSGEGSAYYLRELSGGDEIFHPLAPARSNWNPKHVRGPAITSLLAGAAERDSAEVFAGMRPARITVELFRPTRMEPCRTRSTVVQRGRRVGLIDSSLIQEDEVVARAQTVFILPARDAPSPVWSGTASIPAPAPGIPADPEGRLYRSGDRAWSGDPGEHNDAERKFLWLGPRTIIEGEEPTTFQVLGMACDMTNLVVHWSPNGVEHINVDASISISRLPSGDGIGLAATGRAVSDGISVGNALVFDRAGVFGQVSVTALANPGRAVRAGAIPRE
jgi:hypothetical protein